MGRNAMEHIYMFHIYVHRTQTCYIYIYIYINKIKYINISYYNPLESLVKQRIGEGILKTQE